MDNKNEETSTTKPGPDLPSGAGIYLTMFGIFTAMALFILINWILMKRDMKRERRAAIRGESRRQDDDEEDEWVNPRGSIQAESISSTVRSLFGFGARSSRGYSRLDLEEGHGHESTKLIEFDEDDLKQT